MTDTPATERPAPEPGVYQGVSFDDYLAWPLVSRSALLWMEESPAHCRASQRGEIEGESTRAQKFGTAMHAALLEPDHYKADYLIASPCSALLKSGTRQGQECGATPSHYLDGRWTCGKHAIGEPPREFVTIDESERIAAIAKKVQSHAVVNLFRHRGGFEASIVGELEGVRCKIRCDKLRVSDTHLSLIADVKKVRMGYAGQSAFFNSVQEYGYEVQAAFYLDVAEAATGHRFRDKVNQPTFFFVVIEDSPPHEIGVYQITDELYSIGRSRYRNALLRYKECKERNEWPGICTDINYLDVPTWYLRKYGLEGR